MLEVVPAVPSCRVVQHERGTKKEGLADVGCVCQPGDHVWQLGVAGAGVTNFAVAYRMVCWEGTSEGSVGRAAEMMLSTAHTPTAVLVRSPRGLAGEKGLECGGLVEAPIGRTPLPRDGSGRECGGALDLTHITLILTVAVLHSSFGLSHHTLNVRILPTPIPITGPLALGVPAS